MNKENRTDKIDEIISKEKQIHIDLANQGTVKSKRTAESDDYHTMIKDLILMALPSPSQHVH